MTNPDFLDKLTSFVQNALAGIQENTQLRAENTQLKAANTDLATKLAAVSSYLNEDESEKVATATKLSSLEQLLSQYELTITPPVTDTPPVPA